MRKIQGITNERGYTRLRIWLEPKRKADGSPSTGPLDAAKAARPVNYKLRLRVLNKNPNLKMLHRELVLGKQITEEEFWEGREVSDVEVR